MIDFINEHKIEFIAFINKIHPEIKQYVINHWIDSKTHNLITGDLFLVDDLLKPLCDQFCAEHSKKMKLLEE